MGVLLEALETAWKAVGLDRLDGADEVFRQLVTAGLIEPTSKQDSLRVLAEAGLSPVSYATVKRHLPSYAAEDFTRDLSRLLAGYARIGRASLVLFDVTTLYFETDKADGFREPGLSKERRLEPQISVGLLTDETGFPLRAGAFGACSMVCVTHPPQVVLTLGLEIERGDVVEAQGQTGRVGDVLEQGPRDALAVAPLPAAPQGAEQGPYGDGLQAQVTQHPGDLGLGGRLDQARQNHLLKGLITLDRLTQAQTLVGAVQGLPQQPGVLGLHRGPGQIGVSRCRFQGLQVQQPLALPGGDLLPSGLQQGIQLGLVVG